MYFLCFYQSSSIDLAVCNDCFAFRQGKALSVFRKVVPKPQMQTHVPPLQKRCLQSHSGKLIRGEVTYGNIEWSIWEWIKENEIAHLLGSLWSTQTEKESRQHTMLNVRAIELRKKVTCYISPSTEETMHPIFVLNQCCFKGPSTRWIFTPT